MSQRQSDPPNAYLAAVVALEALWTGERGEPIRRVVSENTAFAVTRDPARRRLARKAVSRLYDKRSDIAHGRDATSILQKEAAQARFTVAEAILAVTQKCRQQEAGGSAWTREQLRAWIDDMRFA